MIRPAAKKSNGVSDGYAAFIHGKAQECDMHGFEPTFMPSCAMPFQSALIDWATRKGRGAVFADCGLGKTLVQLVYGQNVVRHTNGRVLILAPIAVSAQTVREGEKFGIEVKRSRDGKPAGDITVTNYERLHLFDPDDFTGCVCDESSILKNFAGEYKKQITEFMRRMSYRLLCTATAAPNDYVELGTSSEALGELGYMDMLTRFFKNEQNSTVTAVQKRSRFEDDFFVPKWRLKGHAHEAFWRWVCSWARACRKPSDLGFDDGAFILPPLCERQHEVKDHALREGLLFNIPARGLREQREERRVSLTERCELAARLASEHEASVLWCQLNPEGDLLEKLTPDCVQVKGSQSDDEKEENLLAFLSGEAKRLVTKSKCAGFGLNMQHCAHMTLFPGHSYEAYYQSVRRCWRFGQTRPVTVDVVTTEGERSVLANMQRKATQADEMFTRLVQYMGEALAVTVDRSTAKKERLPQWL
jgi:hypothetical protein